MNRRTMTTSPRVEWSRPIHGTICRFSISAGWRAYRRAHSLAFWLLAMLTACADSEVKDRVKQADIDLHGTFEVRGSLRDTANAVVMALQTLGFKVPLSNLSRGILMTSRMTVRHETELELQPLRGATLTVRQSELQFKIWLSAIGDGRVRVVLVPNSFQEGQHVGFWPWGRALMRGLWSSIRQRTLLALPRQDSRPRDSGPSDGVPPPD
jgi:hypothetical protein